MVSEHSFTVSPKPDPTLASELPKMSMETELARSQCGQIKLQRSLESLELSVKKLLQMVCESFGLNPCHDDSGNQVDANPEPQTDPQEHPEQRIEVIGNKVPKDLEKLVDPVVGLKSSDPEFEGSASPPTKQRNVKDDPDVQNISDEMFGLSSHPTIPEVINAKRSLLPVKISVKRYHKARKKAGNHSAVPECKVSNRLLGRNLRSRMSRMKKRFDLGEKATQHKLELAYKNYGMCLGYPSSKNSRKSCRCFDDNMILGNQRVSTDWDRFGKSKKVSEPEDLSLQNDVWKPGGSFPPKVRSNKYSEGCVYHDEQCVWYVWDPGEVKMLMGFRQKRNFWSEFHHGKYVKDLRLFSDQGGARMEVSFLLGRRGVVDSTVEIMLLHRKYRKMKRMTNKECDHWRSASSEMVDKVCQSLLVTLEAISSEAKSHMELVIALDKHNIFIIEASRRLLVKSGLRILNICVVEEESQKRFPAVQLINFLMNNLDPKSICSELELIFQEMDKHWKYVMYAVRMSTYETMNTVEIYLLAQHEETQGWLLKAVKATCDLTIIMVQSDISWDDWVAQELRRTWVGVVHVVAEILQKLASKLLSEVGEGTTSVYPWFKEFVMAALVTVALRVEDKVVHYELEVTALLTPTQWNSLNVNNKLVYAVIKDRDGKSKAFGFVNLDTLEDADKLVDTFVVKGCCKGTNQIEFEWKSELNDENAQSWREVAYKFQNVNVDELMDRNSYDKEYLTCYSLLISRNWKSVLELLVNYVVRLYQYAVLSFTLDRFHSPRPPEILFSIDNLLRIVRKSETPCQRHQP